MTVGNERRSQAELIARLSRLGLTFRTVTVQTEGDYQVEDADWNFKDVPHLNHVHGLADNVNGLTDRDAVASVTLQRVLGVPLPLVLSHYENAPDCQTHLFTLFTYVVVTEITFEALTPTRTRVVTTYAVGSSRFWMRLFPLVRRLLERNYRTLMSEDLPMRERKGRLRSWGYSFRGDGRRREFTESLDIERDHVIPPPRGPVLELQRIDVSSLAEGVPRLVGRSDHLGLRIERAGGELRVFPRMCSHEGAELDGVAADRCGLRCPWHGRRVAPIGVIDLDGATPVLEVENGRLRVDGGVLLVEPEPAG